MPRKSALPAVELEILARLKSSRLSLELPRRLFAKAAGVDSSIIVRLELHRMPLRFGIGRALCDAHSINPEWLATGEGSPQTAFGMPFLSDFEADENALFSTTVKKALSDESAAWWNERETKSSNSFARGMLGEFWSQVIDQAFEKVPDKKLNVLDAQMRAVLEEIVGRAPDHPALKHWRQQFPQISHLTDKTTSAQGEPVMPNQWNRLKARIQKSTAKLPGGKSALAKFLGVDLTQLSKWLTDSEKAREPGADYTLKMLHWVQEHESQK